MDLVLVEPFNGSTKSTWLLNMIKLQLKKLVKTEKCEKEGIVKNGLGLRGKRYDVHPHLPQPILSLFKSLR
ncbi:hypothetical protein L2E82_19665 [Cichorium intybus]|uniref:Uncharacterized protein n=1 Tax=Cichorium intybus TaxID=13427 RepID=A0ACB9FD86_CICIN|nr:hypothetical protein L2E82_19665 [Cichorium intybus]